MLNERPDGCLYFKFISISQISSSSQPECTESNLVVQKYLLHRDTLEDVVSNVFKFIAEKLLILGNDSVENRLPVLVHKAIHRFAKDFVAVEKILELECHVLWLEFDFVVNDVDVGFAIVGLREVIAGKFMSGCQLMHGNVRAAFASDS